MTSEIIAIRVTKPQKIHLQEQAFKEKRTLSNYIKIKLGLL